MMNLYQRCQEVSDECTKIIKEKFNVSVSPFIFYDLKSKNTLGSARHSEGKIRLNDSILHEFGEVYINEIFRHEFAHLVVRELFDTGYFKKRPKPHGKEFKYICSIIGGIPSATTRTFQNATFFKDLEKKSKKVGIEYQCLCCTHILTKFKHNKILRGSSYFCTLCGSELKLKGSK